MGSGVHQKALDPFILEVGAADVEASCGSSVFCSRHAARASMLLATMRDSQFPFFYAALWIFGVWCAHGFGQREQPPPFGRGEESPKKCTILPSSLPFLLLFLDCSIFLSYSFWSAEPVAQTPPPQ